MSKKIQPSTNILDNLQAEIAPEASPALNFFIKHASKIGLGLAAFILVIVGVSLYEWQHKRSMTDAQNELGRILTSTSGTEQIAALEMFAKSAPQTLQTAVTLAKITARGSDYQSIATDWNTIATTDTGALAKMAELGKAEALAAAGEHESSMILLESIVASSDKTALTFLAAAKLTTLAELAGQPARALSAAEFVTPLSPQPEIWEQRIAKLRAQIPAQ